jgi:hypothetical protein
MRSVRVALFWILAVAALGCIFTAGDFLERALPGHPRDTSAEALRNAALYSAGFGVLFALAALYLGAGLIRGSATWRVPLSGFLMIPVLLASSLPYDGWIGSGAVAINLLLLMVAIALAWATVRCSRRRPQATR